MRAIMDAIIRRFLVIGCLRIRWPDGKTTVYQGAEGPDATMVVRDWTAVRRFLLNPTMAFGECYMDGSIAPSGCTIYDLLDLMLSNIASRQSFQPVLVIQDRLGRLLRRLAQWNPAYRSRTNVAHHYDLDGRLYRRFLDEDMQYSCAYFPTGSETLEQAQAAKKRHIARKLRLDRPGLRVLDIGSGWGGMALTLARDYGCEVTGITLSAEQLTVSRERAAAAGLSDRVRFELRDYRDLEQQYDRIVSVGMFEHVGISHFPTFFDTLYRGLAPGGVALLHSIGRLLGPAFTNPWLAKYIFPGGYAPALSEVLPSVEKSGLFITDIEIWRLHYAQTLRHWRARFDTSRADIAALYDERFCRMFEFYLAGSELSFRRNGQMVFQLQLSRDLATVPLSRDYITSVPVEDRQSGRVT